MNSLAADQLFADPRVAQAKRLVLDALADHQRTITTVRPPVTECQATYQQTIEQFNQVRGGDLFYRYLGSGIGNGALVELADGSVKYDMVTGIGVHVLGHSHPALVEAALDAAIRNTVMQGNLQQNTESLALSQMLLEAANRNGAVLDHCFLTTSGAMANENGLKLVFQHKHPANRVLAFDRCFMGRTLALAQITDRPGYRTGLPHTLNVDYVPFFDYTQPKRSTDRAVRTLVRHLECHPGRHAAMCFELVQGEGGYYPGDRGFFVALMEVLTDRGVAVFIDEVQTFGRTTELFAFQHYGLDQYVDLVTIGKLSQVCATLYRARYKPKPGLISQTFTGATASILAAQTIVPTLVEGGHFGPNGRNMQIQRRFADRLDAIAARRPGGLSGPYGIGGMIAFTPFDGRPDKVKRFVSALFDAGVIAFVAGTEPLRVRLLVPVGAITDTDIDAVCTIIEQTLVDTAATIEESTPCS
ncbi:MAG: aminotransferase class III-fold pyridoxal phosphate-dependent enzyme [Phycisphaeraceae bacterium]